MENVKEDDDEDDDEEEEHDDDELVDEVTDSGGRVGGSGKREDMSDRWFRKGSSNALGSNGELVLDPASDGSLRSVSACVLRNDDNELTLGKIRGAVINTSKLQGEKRLVENTSITSRYPYNKMLWP